MHAENVQGSSSAPAAEEGSARQARVAGTGAKRTRQQAASAAAHSIAMHAENVQGSSSAPAAEEGSAQQARVAGAGAKRPRQQAGDVTSAAEVAAHQSEGDAVEGRGKRLRKEKKHFGDS